VKIEPSDRKLHPKVRMTRNGDETVSALRAGCASSLRLHAQPDVAQRCDLPAVGRKETAAKRGSLEGRLADNVTTSVFIRLHASSGSEKGKSTGFPHGLPEDALRRGNLVTAELTFAQMKKLAKDPAVAYIELGDPLKPPQPAVEERHSAAPQPREFDVPEKIRKRHKYGEDVLIGIIDVGGFDFEHLDFMRDGKSRFVAIWDQGGNKRKPPNDTDLNYGSLITEELIAAAIEDAAELGIPATTIERQSQMQPGSHGTHVASIAAGNSGICRNAKIAGVLISIPQDEMTRRESFYDSARIAHAIDWLMRLAVEKNCPLISINISLGTNGHAHDASNSVSRWIDHAMAIPGRCVTVAAGNAGQEAAMYEGDLGFVMGRIHTSGVVASKGLHQDIEWVVYGDGKVDVSENELEIWYGAQDRFAVRVRTPDGTWLDPVIEPRQFIENRQLPDGSMISIYNELYHPANGANYIGIYLSPFLGKDAVIGVPKGTWLVRLIGHDVRNGAYHAWIERDDPRRRDFYGENAWAFPSFFSNRSNVDHSSVSSLACGRFIISAANLDEAADRISVSSSQGPTRDGRFKPDIAAPGTRIVAAKGFAPGDPWMRMSGTSMASPYVCGVAGLMLNLNPTLTSSQIEGIMQRTAQPLPGATYAWKNDAGYGRIDPAKCLIEAASVHNRKDVT